MRPNIPYNPNQTSAFAVEKSTIRTLYAIAAARGFPLLHLNIKSAFTTEPYEHDRPVYVRQMPRFNSQLTHTERSIGQLRLNIYDKKPAYHIYHTGLNRHLRKQNFSPSEADPFLYATTPTTVLPLKPSPFTIFWY